MDFNPENAVPDSEGFNPDNAVEVSNADFDAGDAPARSMNSVRKYEQESMDKLDRYVESRRGRLNAREGWYGTEVGRRWLDNQSGAFEREQIKFYEKNRAKMEANGVDVNALIAAKDAEATEKWEKQQRVRESELREYGAIQNWTAEPHFGKRLAKMFESVGGQFAGSALSPESMLPVGKGATALNTFLKGGTLNAGVGYAQDLESQKQGIKLGTQDDYDDRQSLESVVLSFLMGGGGNVLGHHGSFKPRTQNLGPSGEALSPAEVQANARAAKLAEANQQRQAESRLDPEGTMEGEGGLVEGVDRSAVQQPDPNQYPPISDEFRIDKPLDESQAAFVDESRMVPDDQYPEILDTTAPLDYPKIERGSGPEDVIFTPLEDAPYMPGRLAEQANVDEVPGSHEMQFLPGDNQGEPLGVGGEPKNPYASQAHVDAVNEANRTAIPDSKEPLQGTHKMGFRGGEKTEPLRINGKHVEATDEGIRLAKVVSGAKNVGELIDLAEANATTPEAKGLVAKVKAAMGDVGRDVPVEFEPKMMVNRDRAGEVATDHVTGKRVLRLDPYGMMFFADEPIIHEITHIPTNDALYAYAAGTGTPAQMQYGKRIEQLRQHVITSAKRRGIKLDPETVRNLNEFNTHGLTNPDFIKILKKIPMMGENAFKRLLNWVADFLRLDPKEKNAYINLAEKMSDWKNIQGTDATRARDLTILKNAGKTEVDSNAMTVKDMKFFSTENLLREFIAAPGQVLHLDRSHVGGTKTDPFIVDKVNIDKYGFVNVYGQVPGEARGFYYPQSFTEVQAELGIPGNPYTLGKNFINVDFLVELANKRLQEFTDWSEKSVSQLYKEQELKAADKGWTNIFMKGGPWKKQSGYVDLKVIFDSFAGAFDLTPAQKEAYAKKLAAHHGQFSSPQELKNWLSAGNKVKDLPGSDNAHYSGVFTVQNQLAMMSDENPIIPFVFNHLFDKNRQAETRMFKYDDMAGDSIKWTEKNVVEAVTFFREWERLNANPKERQLRSQLAADPAAMKSYFQSKGLSPDAVDQMVKFMDVLSDVQKTDTGSLSIVSRTLEDEPLYFPLGRKGPYHFIVTSPEGRIEYAGGHDTLSDAHQQIKAIKARMPSDWQVSGVTRTDPTRVLNSAMSEAMMQGAPDWLREAAMTTLGKKLEYRRNFELGRGNTEVGGYIGEVDPKTPAEYKKMLNKYLDAFSHRVRESHHLETSVPAIDIAKTLLGEDSKINDLPNTRAWLHKMINRAVGIDQSLVSRPIDKPLQAAADAIGKQLTKLDGWMKDYKPGENESVIAPNLMKSSAHAFGSLASLWKIGLSPQVMGGNLVSNVIPWMYGARDMARMGKSPIYAAAAQLDHLAYMITGGNDPRFAWVKDKMAQAKKEGVIDPHGREDFSAIENIDRTHAATGAGGTALDNAANAVYSVVQKPRDWIEQATNYSTILYNHMLVKRAFPELSEHAHDQVVYNLARSFAGDYSKMANLFLYEHAGTPGHLLSNFAKWKFNRTSRYVDDIIMASSMSKYGVTAAMPLMWSMAIGLTMAGAQGAIGAVEYEALRKFGQQTGAWDWKPLAAIIGELPFMNDMDPSGRTALEKGMITAFSDHVSQTYFDEPSGPDISGSIREASVLEPPMMAIGLAKDLAVGTGTAMKHMMSSSEMTKMVDEMPEGFAKKVAKWIQDKPSYGVTNDENKAAIKALPTVLQGLVLNQFAHKIEKDGKTKYIVPEGTKDQGNYERSEFQQNLSMIGGLRTTEENRHHSAKEYHGYQKRDAEKKFTALKEGIIGNLDDAALVDRNAALILENHGEDALKGVAEELRRISTEKMQTDYFGNQQLAASRARDAIAAQKAFERIQRALDSQGLKR